ncbi:MAG: Crp/Fnr family transcriptional regulator [Magnetovibrionaceae bacterium]
MKKTDIAEAWDGTARCDQCGIRDLVLFADLTEPDFHLIHLPIEERTLGPGEALYEAAEEGRALYTIRRGLVKLVQYLPDGSQRIVRLLKPGATAGLEVLVTDAYEHSAIVLNEAFVCRLPREVIVKLNTETPRLYGQLMKRWHASVEQADEWLTGLSTGKAQARLARLILQLVEENGTFELFKREDLGAILGITTETASRSVSDMKRTGAITQIAPNRFRCDVGRITDIAYSD